MTRSAVDEAKPARAREVPEPPADSTGRRRFRTDLVTIVLFLLPALVLFGLLVLAPILLASYTSLFKWNGLGGPPEDFIGLDNFTRLFSDKVFLGDLQHAAILIALTVVFQLPFALAIALLLCQRIRGRMAFRLLFFAPYVLSEVIAGVLFAMVFSPNRGLANHLFGLVGLEDLATNWLADPAVVLYSLFFVITWKYFGFHMILYVAARQAIPDEIIEAATIDGASPWETFRYVTLPLLGPTIRISIFLAVIGTIQLFDLVWVLTRGGPIHASETMAVTMFDFGFVRSQVGYGSAISVVMFMISFVFALFYQRFVMRRDIEGAVTGMRDRR
ncbi:MAG TPA: sugar ABC transporter permease [Actinophytocola sp.]|uniref:carbohydrate ABC transporter permease n=1 Tax=Actinophytocola sp. TaxID=1872138 RepID=UPI002DBE30B8|nr:sugar ABC transporter permease [Actinophytocola sp.]HEU5472277.1 sugar ABC transporter permease [Actinophytocola sp.]